MKYKNKGVTLLEALAFLIVSSILVISAFTFYATTTSKKKEQDIISSIGSLQMVVNDQYHHSGYEGVDNSVASTLKGSPFGLEIDGNTITHQLGDDLIISGNKYGFQISLEGLSTESCISLGTRKNLADYIGLGEDYSNIDLGVTELTTFCNSGDSNTLSYIYTNNLSNFIGG